MLYNPKWNEHVAKIRKPKLAGWRRVLWEAADLIETNGWMQHEDHTKEGWCIVGAIHHFHASINSTTFAEKQVSAALSAESIEEWNDDPLRTKSSVVAKLREVALS